MVRSMASSEDAHDIDAYLASMTGRVVDEATTAGDLAAGGGFAALMARLWEMPLVTGPPPANSAAPTLHASDLAPTVFRADRGWPPQ
jgi:hypothetical protein